MWVRCGCKVLWCRAVQCSAVSTLPGNGQCGAGWCRVRGNVVQYDAVWCSGAVGCSVVLCGAVWCSVVQCRAVSCSVVQFRAMWYRVVQCEGYWKWSLLDHACCDAGVCVCVAVCCSVLQWLIQIVPGGAWVL